MGNLSLRENDLIRLLFQGKSNKQIAYSLGISERTVEFHLKNIYEKMRVSSRIELILKLGKSTADFTDKPVESTVETQDTNMDNGNQTDSLHSPENLHGVEEPVNKKDIAIMKKYIPLLPMIVIFMGLALIVGGIIIEQYAAVIVGICSSAAATYHLITHQRDL